MYNLYLSVSTNIATNVMSTMYKTFRYKKVRYKINCYFVQFY